MGEHDLIREEGDTAHCACGWSGPREDHLFHFRVSTAREELEEAKARAALREAKEGNGGA